MELYKVVINSTPHGYLAVQPEFDLAIDADTIENAVCAMKNQIEQNGVIKLKNGEALPEGIDSQIAKGEYVIYITTDIENKFKESARESVRKNISMPSWMDIQLRRYGVDASKLFQDAAVSYLEKQESRRYEPREYKPITTLDELENNVDKELLQQYTKEYVKKILG